VAAGQFRCLVEADHERASVGGGPACGGSARSTPGWPSWPGARDQLAALAARAAGQDPADCRGYCSIIGG